VNEEVKHTCVADLAGKRHDRGVMKACVRGKRAHQMVDEDHGHSERAKNIQVGTVSHKKS
jgi:hypothetical protein